MLHLMHVWWKNKVKTDVVGTQKNPLSETVPFTICMQETPSTGTLANSEDPMWHFIRIYTAKIGCLQRKK